MLLFKPTYQLVHPEKIYYFDHPQNKIWIKASKKMFDVVFKTEAQRGVNKYYIIQVIFPANNAPTSGSDLFSKWNEEFFEYFDPDIKCLLRE